MHNGMDKYYNTLRFGESWEKFEAMKELEEIAMDCRIKADTLLSKRDSAVERERKKPWRAFRVAIGSPLFNVVLDIAQSNSGSELRNLAADILAHLWHPATVDRLVEDLKENSGTLQGTQIIGIFQSFSAIGTEVAVKALISLWDIGWRYEILESLAACNSKTGEAFLMDQVRYNKDVLWRENSIHYLNTDPYEEKTKFLLEIIKTGTPAQRYLAIRKITEMHLDSLVPDITAIYNQCEELVAEELISRLRRCNVTEGKHLI